MIQSFETPVVNHGCHIRYDYLSLCNAPPFNNPQMNGDIKIEYGSCARMECCSGSGESFSAPAGGEFIYGPILHNGGSAFCGQPGVEFVVYWFWQSKSVYKNYCFSSEKNFGPRSCP